MDLETFKIYLTIQNIFYTIVILMILIIGIVIIRKIRRKRNEEIVFSNPLIEVEDPLILNSIDDKKGFKSVLLEVNADINLKKDKLYRKVELIDSRLTEIKEEKERSEKEYLKKNEELTEEFEKLKQFRITYLNWLGIKLEFPYKHKKEINS